MSKQQHLFNLLIYKIKNQYDLYYDYLEGTGLPFFLSNNQFTMIDKFGKQLYQQFMDSKKYEKAAQVSSLFRVFLLTKSFLILCLFLCQKIKFV
ncbi:hypothetical protein ABE41_001640 [Fictibacillus arsenicus]|uniref:Uncharacterized protein n=1 Tax=Fictibacillus arsenicus TaxID=255247 RepID=A0A1B1YZW5_9BACL|nr:hypothetical protein ABE41_001640 [Fictibacillus arsenicus]